MPARAPYRRSVDRSAETRRRIVDAVYELLAERKFHECKVEDVAERAGVSRATLYQHFRSRLELIDAVCDVMGVNPALVELRRQIDLPDPDEALAETIAHAVRFWESEDGVLSQLEGNLVMGASRALCEEVAFTRSRSLSPAARSSR